MPTTSMKHKFEKVRSHSNKNTKSQTLLRRKRVAPPNKSRGILLVVALGLLVGAGILLGVLAGTHTIFSSSATAPLPSASSPAITNLIDDPTLATLQAELFTDYGIVLQ